MQKIEIEVSANILRKLEKDEKIFSYRPAKFGEEYIDKLGRRRRCQRWFGCKPIPCPSGNGTWQPQDFSSSESMNITILYDRGQLAIPKEFAARVMDYSDLIVEGIIDKK